MSLMNPGDNRSEKPQFLLLMRQPYDAAGARPDPAQMQEIMGRFAVWLDGIRANTSVLSTNGLEDRCNVLRGPRGARITDGPYAETKEIIGGYVLITADSFEHAMAIGRECPGHDYGMAVEVRPVIQR
jgi:hypothetical protein